jgi:hypothetical protein
VCVLFFFGFFFVVNKQQYYYGLSISDIGIVSRPDLWLELTEPNCPLDPIVLFLPSKQWYKMVNHNLDTIIGRTAEVMIKHITSYFYPSACME